MSERELSPNAMKWCAMLLAADEENRMSRAAIAHGTAGNARKHIQTAIGILEEVMREINDEVVTDA